MEALSRILPRVWAAPAWKKGLKAAQVLDRWESIVGKDLARAVRPVGFARGVLTLTVPDHIWRQRLRFEERRILSLLNEAAGETIFEKIRFLLRRPPFEKKKDPRRNLSSGRLIKRFSQELAVIEDEELKEAFLKLRLTLAQKRLR